MEEAISQQQTNKDSSDFSNDIPLNTLLNRVVLEVKTYSDRLNSQLKNLSDIGRALSGERNLNDLLTMIVDHACNFTHADGGTLYLLSENKLHFKIVQNKSQGILMNGESDIESRFPPLELKESNVSAYVAIHGKPVNIPDVYDSQLFDFTGPKKFDKANNYRSKSMLVIPMKNHEEDIIGVLQLLNAQDLGTGKVIPFSPDFENMTESLASQAAIAVSNVNLIDDIEKLFESFVEVMATAIDEKSPVTGGHIRRVANLTMVMAEVVHAKKEGVFEKNNFSPEKFYELRIAAWMHDIGKVTTPVEVIEKAKKLQTIFDRIHHVDARMKYIIQAAKMDGMKNKIKLLENKSSLEEVASSEEEVQQKIETLQDIRKFILQCNEPGEFLEDEKITRLEDIQKMTFIDIDGTETNYLTMDELKNLSIRKGSITEEERQIMQNHASITLDMLHKIPFTKKLKNIPHFAGAHHECLDGSGYPLGLKEEEIPFEGKLMAVTDIAEALTASDRPYKKAMPLEKVYSILRSMAENRQLDHDLVELFINDEIYPKYLEKHKSDHG
jgi:HD-GYP domain-containing protein (c-di-GMP phosphodiesterase class II)